MGEYGWMTKMFVVLLICSGIAQRARSFLISIKAITEAHKGNEPSTQWVHCIKINILVHVYTMVNSHCTHTHTHAHAPQILGRFSVMLVYMRCSRVLVWRSPTLDWLTSEMHCDTMYHCNAAHC